MTMFNERYQLHWITALISVLKTLKDMIIPIILIVFVNGTNHTGKWYLDYFNFLIFGVMVIVFFLTGIIKWKRYIYWFEDNELRIEYGLFVKKKRYIPFDRIQSLDYTEGLLHRPFNLVRVNIETAGGSSALQAEAELTAITKDAAAVIEEEIAAAKRRGIIIGEMEGEETHFVEEEPLTQKVFAMSNKDLFMLATTSGGIGLIISGAVVFLSQFADLLPFDRIYQGLSFFIKSGLFLVAFIIFIVLLIIWSISVGMTFLAYYGFMVQVEEEDIVITRGLLEKRRVTVPLNRVQSVRVIENPLRQLFGYASVVIDSAGGGIAREGARINLLPLAKKKTIEGPLRQLFPELIVDAPTKKLPTRSKGFYYRLHFIWMLPIIGVCSYYFFPYGFLSLLIVPIIIFWGVWRQRSAAYEVCGNQLTMRFREISVQTVYMMKKRIQSMEMKQNYFHRKKRVATVSAAVKSGMIAFKAEVKHMEVKEAEEILAWYEPKVAVVQVEEEDEK